MSSNPFIQHALTMCKRLLLFVLLLLVACQPTATAPSTSSEELVPEETVESTAEASSAAESAADERVQIRWFVGIGAGSEPTLFEPQARFVEEFNNSQDEIELILDIVDSDMATNILVEEFAEGNPPDIVGPIGIRGRDTFLGQWLDLTSYVEATNYDFSGIDPALVDFYEQDGALTGLPFAVYPSSIFFNKDLFDAAGVPYPPQEYGQRYTDINGQTRVWDMNALRDVAMLLTLDANGRNATDPDFDHNNIVQYGYDLGWTDLRGHLSLFGAETLVDVNGRARMPLNWQSGLQWYYDGFWRDYFVPNAEANPDILPDSNGFSAGNVAMLHSHLWFAGCCMSSIDANWDMAVVPSFKGTTVAKLHADTFHITAATQHPDEAFKVLTYLVGEGSNALLQVYGGMPARTASQDEFFKEFSRDRFQEQDINWQVVIDGASFADNPSHESYLPNFLTAEERYQEFWTLLTSDPDLDLAQEIDILINDLQTIYDSVP